MDERKFDVEIDNGEIVSLKSFKSLSSAKRWVTEQLLLPIEGNAPCLCNRTGALVDKKEEEE